MTASMNPPVNAPMNPQQGHLVVLAAGGTGGHMFPAEALAAELAGRGCRMAVITDRRGGAWQGASAEMETHYIRASGIAGASERRG